MQSKYILTSYKNLTLTLIFVNSVCCPGSYTTKSGGVTGFIVAAIELQEQNVFAHSSSLFMPKLSGVYVCMTNFL